MFLNSIENVKEIILVYIGLLNKRFQKLDEHPSKKTWESQNFYTHSHFFIRNSKKTIKTVFFWMGKENMGIPKFVSVFNAKKYRKYDFFTVLALNSTLNPSTIDEMVKKNTGYPLGISY